MKHKKAFEYGSILFLILIILLYFLKGVLDIPDNVLENFLVALIYGFAIGCCFNREAFNDASDIIRISCRILFAIVFLEWMLYPLKAFVFTWKSIGVLLLQSAVGLISFFGSLPDEKKASVYSLYHPLIVAIVSLIVLFHYKYI